MLRHMKMVRYGTNRPRKNSKASAQKKPGESFDSTGFVLFQNPAIPTFALVYTIIGSESLTTVFGMGTGDPFRYGHREGVTRAVARRDPCWIGKCQNICSTIVNCRHRISLQGLSARYRWSSVRPLVLVSLTPYGAYTSSLSTW